MRPWSPVHPDLAGARVALQPLATGLSQPLFATGARDGGGRLFVVEQAGTVRVVLEGSTPRPPAPPAWTSGGGAGRGATATTRPRAATPPGVTMPLAEHGHDQGCAIIGGVVYRGAAIPKLDGACLFGDYCSGRLRAIDAAGGERRAVQLLSTGLAISSISTDDTGEVVVTDLRGGTVQRLAAAN